MAIVIKPLDADAVRMKPFAGQLGQKVQKSGGIVHEVIDGFLLRAVSVPPNVIVYIIPSPRYLGASYWGTVPASGVAPFLKLELPDAVSRLSPNYGGIPFTASLLGFYGEDGVVTTEGSSDLLQRRYAAFMEGPLSVCRSALLTGVQAQLFSGETLDGFACQVLRLNANTKLATSAPEGIPFAALTGSLAPYEAGNSRVRLIEIPDAALGIPDIGFNFQRFSGQPLEFTPADGLVCMTAWYSAAPSGFSRRGVFARYRLVPVPDSEPGEPSMYSEVVWSTTVTLQDTPPGAYSLNMFFPQTWGVWSHGATEPPAEGENPVVIALAMGFYSRTEDDPQVGSGTSGPSVIHTYFLRIDWETGAITQTLIEAFDTWDLNYTDLLYKERTPQAMYSVDGSPKLFCSVRMTTYVIEPGVVDRKSLPPEPTYTRLSDLEHSIFDEFGNETPVSTGDFYIAYAAKFLDPIIGGPMNDGRRYYGGYHTEHSATGTSTPVLFGEYWPVYQNSLGGAPLYRVVCEYAPNVLVAVVSPNVQFLDATQDRYLALVNGTTGELLLVSDEPIMPTKYAFSIPFQISCYEQGEYDFTNGVIARHAALIITIGENGEAGGVFTTHDFGTTMTPLVDSTLLRGLNVHYLGAELSPARLGRTTGSPTMKAPLS